MPDNRQPTALRFAEELHAGAGGAAGFAEIAHAVRTQCADLIAARTASVARAVGVRSKAMPDRDAADTFDDAASMQMRRGSLAIRRPSADTATIVDIGNASTLPDRVANEDREKVSRPRRPARVALIAALAAAIVATLVAAPDPRLLADGRERSFDLEIVSGKEANSGTLTW